MMSDLAYLKQFEIVEGRSFTNPQENVADVKILHCMVEKLGTVLAQPDKLRRATGPTKLNLQTMDGSVHRIVIVDWIALQTRAEITMVGFFGQAQTGIDHTPIMILEDQLIDQLGDFPGLLCYYNLRLPDESYGNLVLCTGPKVKDDWRTNPTHIRAAEEFAPRHYQSIRLHNGVISGGINPDNITLLRTKYYDFQADEPWRAVREFVG